MRARAQQKNSLKRLSLKTPPVTSDVEDMYQVMATASGSMFGTCFLTLPAIYSTLGHVSKQIRCKIPIFSLGLIGDIAYSRHRP